MEAALVTFTTFLEKYVPSKWVGVVDLVSPANNIITLLKFQESSSSKSDIYTTKIDWVVCPPNISETIAGRLMKLAHRLRIASTMIKLISKPILLPILLILVKTIQRIVADPKRKLSPPFDSADSVPSLGHPALGSGKMLSLFTVLCDYSVWVTETGAPGSGKTIQPIRI